MILRTKIILILRKISFYVMNLIYYQHYAIIISFTEFFHYNIRSHLIDSFHYDIKKSKWKNIKYAAAEMWHNIKFITLSLEKRLSTLILLSLFFYIYCFFFLKWNKNIQSIIPDDNNFSIYAASRWWKDVD